MESVDGSGWLRGAKPPAPYVPKIAPPFRREAVNNIPNPKCEFLQYRALNYRAYPLAEN